MPAAKHQNVIGAVRCGRRGGNSRRRIYLRAPDGGTHPRQHFAQVKRLGDVVIRAHFKTDNLVDDIALAGHHDDRNPGVGAHVGCNGQTAFAAELDVERNKVDLVVLQTLFGFAPVSRLQHLVAVRFKTAPQEKPDLGLVIDHQNRLWPALHRRYVTCGLERWQFASMAHGLTDSDGAFKCPVTL